jgi:hypothetical protein
MKDRKKIDAPRRDGKRSAHAKTRTIQRRQARRVKYAAR